MLGKVIIVLFLLMVKQVQVNLIPWSVMEPIAKEFQRNISMSVKMMLMNSEGEDGEIDMKKHSIKIKVVNR